MFLFRICRPAAIVLLVQVALGCCGATCHFSATLSAQESGAAETPKAAATDRNSDQQTQEPAVKLPMEPEVVVFQLEYSGGFRAPLPKDFEPTPRLRIFADGRVVTGQNRPDLPVYEIRLNDRQLNELVSEIVNRYDFFSLDASEIKRQIAETGRRILIADVATSTLTVHLADREHSVALYAVQYCADAFPEIESVQRMADIELLAIRWCSIAEIGGPEILEELVQETNLELQKITDEFSVAQSDLTRARRQPDGSIEARFTVRKTEQDGSPVQPDSGWMVVVTRSPHDPTPQLQLSEFGRQTPTK